MTGITDNSKNGKRKAKPRGKPFVKGDPRINVNGAPTRGASMAEAYQWAMDMTPEVIADILEINGRNDLSRQFRLMPRGIKMQMLFALRVIASAMFDPQASLVNHIIDRVDGPVTKKVEITWREQLQGLGIDPDTAVQQVREWLAAGGALAESESE